MKRSKAWKKCLRLASRRGRKGHAAFDRALHSCLTRAERYGAPVEAHRTWAREEVVSERRIAKTIRSKLKDPPDCLHVANLLRELARVEGAAQANRRAGGGRQGGSSLAASLLHDKFVKKCVLHPRNRR